MDKRIRMSIILSNGLADAGPFSLIQEMRTDIFIVWFSCRNIGFVLRVPFPVLKTVYRSKHSHGPSHINVHAAYDTRMHVFRDFQLMCPLISDIISFTASLEASAK